MSWSFKDIINLYVKMRTRDRFIVVDKDIFNAVQKEMSDFIENGEFEKINYMIEVFKKNKIPFHIFWIIQLLDHNLYRHALKALSIDTVVCVTYNNGKIDFLPKYKKIELDILYDYVKEKYFGNCKMEIIEIIDLIRMQIPNEVPPLIRQNATIYEHSIH